jgi:NADH-quinone oxidoreductase subunit N
MVAAVIAAFLYLRIMVNVWLEPDDDAIEPERVPFTSGLAIAGAAVFTLLVGVWPGWLLDATDTVTQYAR